MNTSVLYLDDLEKAELTVLRSSKWIVFLLLHKCELHHYAVNRSHLSDIRVAHDMITHHISSRCISPVNADDYFRFGQNNEAQHLAYYQLSGGEVIVSWKDWK